MNTIRLHGALKEKFGEGFELDVGSIREATQALCVQLEGFEAEIRQGAYRIVRSRQGLEMELDETLLDLGMSEGQYDVYPVVVGASRGGAIGKIVLGIALIGAVVLTGGLGALAVGSGFSILGISGATIGAFGLMTAAAGVASLFAPQPPAMGASAAEKKDSSYIFNGPENVDAQGVPVPLIYGRCMVGSVVISSELTVDQLLQSGSAYDVDDAYDGWDPNYPDADQNLA